MLTKAFTEHMEGLKSGSVPHASTDAAPALDDPAGTSSTAENRQSVLEQEKEAAVTALQELQEVVQSKVDEIARLRAEVGALLKSHAGLQASHDAVPRLPHTLHDVVRCRDWRRKLQHEWTGGVVVHKDWSTRKR